MKTVILLTLSFLMVSCFKKKEIYNNDIIQKWYYKSRSVDEELNNLHVTTVSDNLSTMTCIPGTKKEGKVIKKAELRVNLKSLNAKTKEEQEKEVFTEMAFCAMQFEEVKNY